MRPRPTGFDALTGVEQPAMKDVLRKLLDHPSPVLRLPDVLDALGMTYAAAAEVLDALEAHGLVGTTWSSPVGPFVRLPPEAGVRLGRHGVVEAKERLWEMVTARVKAEALASRRTAGRVPTRK